MAWWLTFMVVVGGSFVGLIALGVLVAIVMIVRIIIAEKIRERKSRKKENLVITADKAHRFKK